MPLNKETETDSIHKGKMEQIFLAYSLSKEIVTTIMMFYKNMEAMVCLCDDDTSFFDIVARVSRGNTLTSYMFIIFLDYALRTLIDIIKDGFTLKRQEADDIQQKLRQTTEMIYHFSQIHLSKPNPF